MSDDRAIDGRADGDPSIGGKHNSVVLLRDVFGEDLAAIERLLTCEESDWCAEDVVAFIGKKNHHARVLTCDGRIQGVLIASLVSDECNLLYIIIRSRFRRSGLARQLLRDLRGLAVRCGAATIFLEVRASNSAAIALYSGEGFSLYGRRTDYYPLVDSEITNDSGREDALLLSLVVI